jgi:hypothetical protein
VIEVALLDSRRKALREVSFFCFGLVVSRTCFCLDVNTISSSPSEPLLLPSLDLKPELKNRSITSIDLLHLCY